MSETLFPLGQVVATRGAISEGDSEVFSQMLSRHHRGDWGDVCEEDQRSNDEALESGFRLFSVFEKGFETKFWVITEADRSVTTILLPEEY